jgi:threonine aldolase
MKIDFRSDTFTQPTPPMLQTMMQAPVGDDVFGEDPTVNELEAYTADLFGHEAAIFCASGTMTNQIGIKCHTQPGDEVICDETSHVYQYEGGGIAFNSGCSVKLLPGDRGRITAAQVAASVNNRNDPHKAYSRLVCIENTSNRGGGSCYELEELVRIKKVCEEQQLAFHLDGARLMNALVAKNETPQQYGALFHSISLCLSKGLGAPVGSMLTGNKAFIGKARRFRKVFGGGMRQAGYLAAAGLYALRNNVQRLQTDHAHARVLAQALAQKPFIGNILPVETNIVIFEVTGAYTPQSFTDALKAHDIWVIPFSATSVRMVTHLDISEMMIERTIETIGQM